MGTTTMQFSRSAGNYVTYVTQNVGDSIEFKTTQSPSFPGSTKATNVSVDITQGLKSGSGNYRETDIAVEFLCNGEWCWVWSGSKALSGDGGDGTCRISNITIPSGRQKSFASYGVDKIRILQDGSYAVKGMSTAYGSATFTYETDTSGSGSDVDEPEDDEGNTGTGDGGLTGSGSAGMSAPYNIRFDSNPTRKPTTMHWDAGVFAEGCTEARYIVTVYEKEPGYPTFKDLYELYPGLSLSVVVDPPSNKECSRQFNIQSVCTAKEGGLLTSEVAWSPVLYYDPAPHPGEPLFSEAIVANETFVKVEHLIELREAVNALREYYCLPVLTWASQLTLTSFIIEWSLHIAEIRGAIDEMVDTPVEWIAATENSPKKAIIDQLRDVLKTL